jgi:hypothetical protein
MTHKKHDIAVFIENEEMLKEVGNKITEHGETLEEDFYLPKQRVFTNNTHVYFHPVYDEWCVYSGYKTVEQIDETPITIPQLEEILKNQ